MKRLIYPVLLGLALAGCSQAKPEASADNTAQPTSAETPNSLLPPLPITDISSTATPTALLASAAQTPHNVIYQGELNLAVTDFNQVTTSINHLLEQYDAYISTAHEARADGQHRQEMTIKAPPTKFVSLVTALGQLGHIENKDIASADIAADVLQTAQRLAAKQATAAKYQQQLAQTATKEAAAQLREQARQLQVDLAAEQAKLQQFGARSSWATLRLRYYQPLSATDVDEPRPAFAPQFVVAFDRGWSVLVEIAVGCTTPQKLDSLAGLVK